jgi:phosphoribosylformylglycinamidine synthase PurS subunit
MSAFSVAVTVSLRAGIADPQGATIERSLPALGFHDVSDVHSGKAFLLTVEADSPDAAVARVEDLCRRFLTNPVIEDAHVSVVG